jgi:hypothetical protein
MRIYAFQFIQVPEGVPFTLLTLLLFGNKAEVNLISVIGHVAGKDDLTRPDPCVDLLEERGKRRVFLEKTTGNINIVASEVGDGVRCFTQNGISCDCSDTCVASLSRTRMPYILIA